MSQSCDLANRKLDLVLVCPFITLNESEEMNELFKSRRGKEALRQGNLPGYHLLNKCEIEGFNTDFAGIISRILETIRKES